MMDKTYSCPQIKQILAIFYKDQVRFALDPLAA
jgi:hypothetical protein